MKNLLPLLVCLLLFSCTEKKKVKNDWTQQNLKGDVKTINGYGYKVIEKSGAVEKDSLKYIDSTIYNSMGFIVENRYKTNKTNARRFRTYDDSNNTLEDELYKDGKLSYRVLKKYNKKNNVIEETEIEAWWLNHADSVKGNLTTDVSSYSYKYDASGHAIEEKANRNGKPWYRFEKILDAKGNVIELKEYYAWDSTLSGFETNKYDTGGNLIERGWYKGNGKLIRKYNYIRNSEGKVTNCLEYYNDGEVASKETFKYDESGNKLEDINYKGDDSIISNWHYEYKKFDAKGNWVEQISYKNDKPETITERTIEYY